MFKTAQGVTELAHRPSERAEDLSVDEPALALDPDVKTAEFLREHRKRRTSRKLIFRKKPATFQHFSVDRRLHFRELAQLNTDYILMIFLKIQYNIYSISLLRIVAVLE